MSCKFPFTMSLTTSSSVLLEKYRLWSSSHRTLSGSVFATRVFSSTVIPRILICSSSFSNPLIFLSFLQDFFFPRQGIFSAFMYIENTVQPIRNTMVAFTGLVPVSMAPTMPPIPATGIQKAAIFRRTITPPLTFLSIIFTVTQRFLHGYLKIIHVDGHHPLSLKRKSRTSSSDNPASCMNMRSSSTVVVPG